MDQQQKLEQFRQELGVEMDYMFLDGLINILSIEGQDIDSLPDSFGDLDSIEILYLKDNNLNSLPPSIIKLRKLRRLVISGNRIEELPSFANFADLEDLDISGNQIRQLPDDIGSCTQLRTLIAGNNELNRLPDSLVNLNNLEKLDLHANNIDELPDDIDKLSSLEYINLNDNNLSELPECIASMRKLHSILLRNNKLTKLIRGLDFLSHLRDFDLSGNDELIAFNKHYEGKLAVDAFFQKYIRMIDSDETHTCPNCNNTQPVGLKACIECGNILIHCAICQWGFHKQDRVSCPRCAANFHREHLKSAFVFSGKCPACKNKIKFSEFR